MAFQLENMDLFTTYFPEDIIKEILLRLPVKSLARFRCVSKTWLFLISSYKFAKAHLKIPRMNNVYIHDKLIVGSKILPRDLYTCSIQSLVQGSETQVYPTTNDNNFLFDRVRFDYNNNPCVGQGGEISIVGSCNGLVCLVFHQTNTIFLFNPTTGKLKKLPDSGTNSESHDYCYGFVYAFGYDELHDDYKVVESYHAMNERGWFVAGGLGLKVYSLRNNSWKPLSNFPAGGGYTYGGMGKFLNGAIHWLVREFSDDVYRAIVCHDLATDTFTVSHLPNICGGDVVVGILEGQLALYNTCPFHMDVWVMKEYGVHKSWTNSVRIPFLLETSFFETNFIRPLPLFHWVEYRKILIDYGTSVGIFDFNNPQPHQFGEDQISVEKTTYYESLISPHLDDELVLRRTMPSEIITEILSRLPAKSLLRFTSVSKEWRSLISSSRFVKAHLKTSITRNDVVLLFGPTSNNDQEFYTHSIDSIFTDHAHALNGTFYSVADEDPQFEGFQLESCVVDAPEAAEIRLVGSCNGLVCLSLSRKIILINPATYQEIMLPDSSTNDERFNLLSYSFGYDEVHSDYKVVELMINFDHVESTLVQIYSMRTNSWQALNWPGGDTCGNPGKFLNGSLHWSVRDLLDGFVIRRFIVSLDLATLTFTRSMLPPNILVDIDDDDAIVDVDIVGGCLGLCCTRRADMDVWVMKEYGVSESWTRVVRMDLGNHDHGFARPRPLVFPGDGKILMNYGSSLKIYDPANPQPHNFDTDFKIDAIAYVETLVPVTLEEEGEDEHNNAVDCC